MTRASKKARERRFLDEWRTLETSCPSGSLLEHERPDFVLHSASEQIGIEITELLVPNDTKPSQIARENYQEHVVDLGARIHAQLGGPALDVAVYFGLGTPVTKQRFRELARTLAEVVQRNTPIDGYCEWQNDSLRDLEFTFVRVFRSASLTNPTWHVWHDGWVPDAQPIWIQNAIDKKAVLRSNKLSQSQIWLLIVSEGFRVSSVAIFGPPVTEYIYNSPFGRVFLFDRMGRRSIQLPTRNERAQIGA